MNFTDEQIKEILSRIEKTLGMLGKRKYQFYYECGLSSALYSNWNTGKVKPSAAMLGKIAKYLGVSYDWLVYGEENKKITATSSDSDRHSYVNNLFDQLTFENQIELIEFLKMKLQSQATPDAQKGSH